jgi:hypothetical protein
MHLTRPRASDVGDACLEGADRSGPSAVGTLELHKEQRLMGLVPGDEPIGEAAYIGHVGRLCEA